MICQDRNIASRQRQLLTYYQMRFAHWYLMVRPFEDYIGRGMTSKPFMHHLATILVGMLGALGLGAWAAEPGSSVVVVYNLLLPQSKDVATHYASQRGVPESQVQGLNLPTTETMTRREYREDLQQPLLKFLETKGLFVFGPDTTTPGSAKSGRKLQQSLIRYLVLSYGVPLRIAEDADLAEPGEDRLPAELRRNGAAVDSELCLLPESYQKVMLAGPLNNPFFGATNAAFFHPTNGILLVARLDGPDASIARGLVDKAMEAENQGLWGRAYFDLRGLTEGPFKKGDDSIAAAARIARQFGLETVTDDKPETFSPGFPMSQIAVYVGWYDLNVSGPFTRPHVEFMPGAFAYHLHSFSASSLRTTNHYWCGPLLAAGAAATMGCVDEPYLDGTPNMDVFLGRWLILGFSFGEAAYAAQSVVSWQTTVIGDPLYQPFKMNPQARHQQLLKQGAKVVEWSYLQWVNMNLAAGASKADFVRYLENLDITRRSAVLTEKLGDLYDVPGKPQPSISAYRRAIKLDPTPQQIVRLTLKLGDKLTAAGKLSDVLKLYDAFIKNSPDYPDAVDLYRKMEPIARKLGNESQAVEYATQIRRLSMSN
jgi:uncharacterized protein (TIGR03790 family)